MLTANVYSLSKVNKGTNITAGQKYSTGSYTLYLKPSVTLPLSHYTVLYSKGDIILYRPDIDHLEAPKRVTNGRILLPYREGMEGNYEGEQIDTDTIIFTKI